MDTGPIDPFDFRELAHQLYADADPDRPSDAAVLSWLRSTWPLLQATRMSPDSDAMGKVRVIVPKVVFAAAWTVAHKPGPVPPYPDVGRLAPDDVLELLTADQRRRLLDTVRDVLPTLTRLCAQS